MTANLIDLLILYLGGVGATLILVRGQIFEPLRGQLRYGATGKCRLWLKPVHDIIHCPQCCGFWVGLLFAAIHLLLQFPLPELHRVFFVCVFACGVSFLSLASDLILSALYRDDTQ
jgi:hypothetical protein